MRALRAEIEQRAQAHGFAVSFAQVAEDTSDTVLMPIGEDVIVVHAEGDDDEAFQTSEACPTFDELSETDRARLRAARDSRQCHCSVCRGTGQPVSGLDGLIQEVVHLHNGCSRRARRA